MIRVAAVGDIPTLEVPQTPQHEFSGEQTYRALHFSS